jgi:hypothetical protein
MWKESKFPVGPFSIVSQAIRGDKDHFAWWFRILDRCLIR